LSGALDRRAAEALVEGLRRGEIASPAAIADAAERLLSPAPGARRRSRDSARHQTGSYYTPPRVVAWILDHALEPVLDAAEARGAARGDLPAALRAVRVLDPCCGGGRFLVPAASRIHARLVAHDPAARMADVVREQVLGGDLQETAIVATTAALRALSGDALGAWLDPLPGIVRADAVLDRPPGWDTVDAVVTNPPFLDQLHADTALADDRAAAVRARWPGAVGAYTDVAGLVALAMLDHLAPAGRVGIVLPQAILATRDARGLRRALAQHGVLRAAWLAGEPVFAGTSVQVVALVVERGGAPDTLSIERAQGALLEPSEAISVPAADLRDAETWAPWFADLRGIPGVAAAATAGTLGDVAAATADFRDEYYGVVDALQERPLADDAAFPPVLTTGLVDPACVRWGQASARLGKRDWLHPRAAASVLAQTPKLARWMAARRVPKVLLATQGRVLEAVVDAAGRYLPTTPLISVLPGAVSPWHVFAVLASPYASAWAMTRYAGAGMSAESIKLAASQVGGIPLPANRPAWDAAAAIAERAHLADAATRDTLLLDLAECMDRAYGLRTREIRAWWTARRPRRAEAP
jgi:SAM-dependent methyltransferase